MGGKLIDKDKVFKMAEEGYSIADICAEIGSPSYYYIKKILENRGLYIGKKIDRGRVFALHKAGWSIKDIAYDCNATESEVQNVLESIRRKNERTKGSRENQR